MAKGLKTNCQAQQTVYRNMAKQVASNKRPTYENITTKGGNTSIMRSVSRRIPTYGSTIDNSPLVIWYSFPSFPIRSFALPSCTLRHGRPWPVFRKVDNLASKKGTRDHRQSSKRTPDHDANLRTYLDPGRRQRLQPRFSRVGLCSPLSTSAISMLCVPVVPLRFIFAACCLQ